jgi:putative ABC transport system ATP-binding protein
LFGDTVYDNLIFPWQIRNKRPEPDAFLSDLAHFDLPETILKKASMSCPVARSSASR